MTMGEKILAMRKARGWSQEELAEQVGVTRQAVSRWESDSAKPDADKIIAVCDLFGVSADYLLRDNYAGERQTQPVAEGTVPDDTKNRERGFSMKPHQWYLLLCFCVCGISRLAIRFMGLMRADHMTFDVFLETEGMGFRFFLSGLGTFVFGALLLLPPLFRFFGEGFRFFCEGFLPDPEE